MLIRLKGAGYCIVIFMSRLPTQYSNLRVIRENQRYATYRAEHEGASVFIKQARSAGLADGIRRELWGLETFRQLSEVHDLGFQVPRVVAIGDDYIVTSWAQGKPVDFDPASAHFDKDIEFFADSLARLDMLTSFAMPTRAKLALDSTGIDRLKNKLQQTAYLDYFDEALIDHCFEYLYKNTEILVARLTHADFTPGNVLVHSGQRTLVDYESVSLLWPRFYDLVNLTINKLVPNPDLVTGCLQIINRYFSFNNTASIEEATPQMNVIAMLRLLSLIVEHMTDPNDVHNTRASMTQELSTRISAHIAQVLAGRPYFEALR